MIEDDPPGGLTLVVALDDHELDEVALPATREDDAPGAVSSARATPRRGGAAARAATPAAAPAPRVLVLPAVGAARAAVNPARRAGVYQTTDLQANARRRR